MGEVCASLTQGILAYNNIDLIPNGYINEFDEDNTGNQIRLLPSSRLQVELQYSVQSDITGTSLNDLSPGGNAGFILGGLGGGAGFGIASAIGCSLLGDMEPTRSQFIFHACEASTKLNRQIVVTQEMIDAATVDENDVVEHEFVNEYIIGVLGVSREPIVFTEEELTNLGSGDGTIRGHNITNEGLIEATFDSFESTGEENLFVEIVRDERKFQYRADNNIPGDEFSGANAFLNASSDDLTDKKIKFRFPFPQEPDPGFEGPLPEQVPVEVGDILYVNYVGSEKRILRHAMFCSSFFFLFPGFLTERIGVDQVKSWSFRPYRFLAHKDVSQKATLGDIEHDEKINADPDLTEEEKEERRSLEFIESQRVVETTNDTKNKRPYVRGIYFADTRGILSLDLFATVSETNVLIPASSIRDQAWWQSFISGLVDFGPGFNEEGHFDPLSEGGNRFLKGVLFDISDHVNAVCYDNDKFGYQRELAQALANVSNFDPEVEGTGVGFPNLDLIRNNNSLRQNYDLGTARFESFTMSSIEGGAYFIRDCNRVFTYDQQFCSSGTLQADMFVRTPVFFDEYGEDTRIYVERFTPQFPLERDGGIWVTTRSVAGATMSIDTHPFDHEAMLVFSEDEKLHYHRMKSSSTRMHLSKSNDNVLDTSRSHSTQSFDTLNQSDVKIVGFDQIIGNQPGYSSGIEITTEGGKIAKGLELCTDVYERVESDGASENQSINFITDVSTGEVTVRGLGGRKIKSIQLFFRTKRAFFEQRTRYISFIFQNEQEIIDNIALVHPGGFDPARENYVIVDTRYYTDDSMKISGEIMNHLEVTKIAFVFIKEEKYEESFIDTRNQSIVYDKSGRIYVFYEDNKANEGIYGDQGEVTIVDGGTKEISCLISSDMGKTWVDHKGVVFSAGEEQLRHPFAVADKIGDQIHLFYVVNDTLLHKIINPTLFSFEDTFKAWKRPIRYNETLPDDAGLLHFSDKGKQLRKLESDIVIGDTQEDSYLGGINNIQNVRRENNLSIRYRIPVEFEDFSEGFPETSYIAFMDKSKSIKVLYSSNGKLFARASTSNGKDWSAIFDDGVFIHRHSSIQEVRFISNIGYAIDSKGDFINLSYISDNMMFVRRFDTKIFNLDAEEVGSILGPDDTNTRPIFVAGNILDELRRAIEQNETNVVFPYGRAALDVFDETMSVSDFGARGFVGSLGLTRFMYQDSNGEIRGFSFENSRPILDSKLRAINGR